MTANEVSSLSNIGVKLQHSAYSTKYTGNTSPISLHCDLNQERPHQTTQGTQTHGIKSCRFPSQGLNFIYVPSSSNMPDCGTRWSSKLPCTTCRPCKPSNPLYTDGGSNTTLVNFKSCLTVHKNLPQQGSFLAC